jgi:hypothetical protein
MRWPASLALRFIKREAPERARALCGFDQLVDLALVNVRFVPIGDIVRRTE